MTLRFDAAALNVCLPSTSIPFHSFTPDVSHFSVWHWQQTLLVPQYLKMCLFWVRSASQSRWVFWSIRTWWWSLHSVPPGILTGSPSCCVYWCRKEVFSCTFIFNDAQDVTFVFITMLNEHVLFFDVPPSHERYFDSMLFYKTLWATRCPGCKYFGVVLLLKTHLDPEGYVYLIMLSQWSYIVLYTEYHPLIIVSMTYLLLWMPIHVHSFNVIMFIAPCWWESVITEVTCFLFFSVFLTKYHFIIHHKTFYILPFIATHKPCPKRLFLCVYKSSVSECGGFV